MYLNIISARDHTLYVLAGSRFQMLLLLLLQFSDTIFILHKITKFISRIVCCCCLCCWCVCCNSKMLKLCFLFVGLKSWSFFYCVRFQAHFRFTFVSVYYFCMLLDYRVKTNTCLLCLVCFSLSSLHVMHGFDLVVGDQYGMRKRPGN